MDSVNFESNSPSGSAFLVVVVIGVYALYRGISLFRKIQKTGSETYWDYVKAVLFVVTALCIFLAAIDMRWKVL